MPFLGEQSRSRNQVFNVAASMCKQAGRVQLEASDIRLAFNTKDKFLHGLTADNIDETFEIIRKPRAELREEKRRGVEFEGYKNVKVVMKRHPAMDPENEQDGCLVCQNGQPHNPETRWKRQKIHPPPEEEEQELEEEEPEEGGVEE